MEKNSWNSDMGISIVKAYINSREMETGELEMLYALLMYPEKYWKLANYYYSHNKAWISEKNTQKLKKLTGQKEAWQNFGTKCLENYPF